jgi:hypothetical protein
MVLYNRGEKRDLRCSETLRSVLIPYRYFRTNNRSHLHDGTDFQMGPICYTGSSVRYYYYSLRNTPEVRRYHLLRNERLKSRRSAECLLRSTHCVIA